MQGCQIGRMAMHLRTTTTASPRHLLCTKARLQTPRRVAVLVDADNASPAYAKSVFEEVAKLGDANVRRVYGNFSNSNPWIPHLQPLSMVPVQQYNYTTVRIKVDNLGF